jgi:hypothetical protein
MASLFRAAQSAALVGEELFTVAEALDHSVSVLQALPNPTPADRSAIARRSAIAQRLRRAMLKGA